MSDLETATAEPDLEHIADTLLHRGIPDPKAKEHRIEESVVLTYGGKQLTVWVDLVDRRISTNIESTDGDQKPYETTVLYLAAKKFMQRAVDDLGASYVYALQSKNQRMRDWARGPGNEIFHWTSVTETSNGNDVYASFVTRFFPKGYELDQEAS